jgi:hypothetical protein
MAFVPHNPSPSVYPPHEPEPEEPPDFSNDRLVEAAQWVALAAAIATVPAGILATAAVVTSYHTGDAPRLATGQWSFVASHATGFITIGCLCAVALAIAIYAVARGLSYRPRGGAIAYFIIAAVFAVLAAVLLLAPGALLGTDPLSVARSQTASVTDASLAAYALLAAAGLLAVAGGLAAAGPARARRRATAGPAQRRPAV